MAHFLSWRISFVTVSSNIMAAVLVAAAVSPPIFVHVASNKNSSDAVQTTTHPPYPSFSELEYHVRKALD